MNLSDILKELEAEENKSLDMKKNNFKLFLLKYLSKWKWFAAGLTASISIALIFAFLSTPLYEIKTTLLLRDKEKGADFSSNAVLNNLSGFAFSSSVENEAEVFKAQSLMIKACQELGIRATFHVPKGFLRWKEIYSTEVPVIVSEFTKNFSADPEVKNTIDISLTNDGFRILKPELEGSFSYGEKVNIPYGTFVIEPNPSYVPDLSEKKPEKIRIFFADPVDYGKGMAENTKVSIVNKLASVIQISILDGHPLKGKHILEKLIEVYNQETENDKNRTALNTIKFIDEQLVDLTAELAAIEKEAEEFKLKNSITDIGSESQLFLSSTTANRQQISELSVQIDVIESIEKYITGDGNNYGMVPSSLTIQDPTLAELITSFNALQREKERMLRTTQPNNPIVLNIDEQLRGLRTNILENLRNIKNGLIISRNSLMETSDQFQSRASRVPIIERQLIDIARKQAIKQEHYILLNQKREEAALTLAATSVTNSKIIDPPTPSEFPVKPKKIIILGVGLILGFLIPFGIIYAKDIIQEKIEFKADIEEITSAPFLGEISRNRSSEGIIAISGSKKSLIAEQFRFIRTNLIDKTNRKNNQAIMVTSGISGEGKTFFSINLAISLGLIGKSVAVMELDLRRPAMLSSLGKATTKGVAEFLESDNIDVDEIILPLDENENVKIIGCGNPPANPAELMANGKLQRLIEELKKRFDYLIIDTAPVGLVSDAFVLADSVDLTIFMIRYNHSSKSQVKTIEDIRKNKKFKSVVIVTNDAKLEMTYGYGSKYVKNYYHA